MEEPNQVVDGVASSSPRYLAAGIGRCWIVDRGPRIIDVVENPDGGWEVLARVDEHTPQASVAVTPYGTVELRLTAILS